MAGEISESFGAWLMLLSSAWEPRTGLWRGEEICSLNRMNPVNADHLRAHSAVTAAGGFAEAKGKYRGSIVESLAVLPIGCCISGNPDNEVRVAGADGSFRCRYCTYVYAPCVCMDDTLPSLIQGMGAAPPDSIRWYYCLHAPYVGGL